MRCLGCLLGLALAAVLLTGCWGRREITETAFAGMMALDWVGGRYRVTLNILLPSPRIGGQAGGGPPRGDPAVKPIWTVRSDGDTVRQALEGIERLSPRRLFLGHVRSVLLGEELARRGIRPVLDYLLRDPEIRPSAWVGVAEGPAAELLTARPTLEDYPSNGPLGFHDQVRRRTSLAPAVRLLHTLTELDEEGVDLVLPVFRLAEPAGVPGDVPVAGPEGREVLPGGAAAFRGDRLVAWLAPEEARGVVWVRAGGGRGSVTAPCPGGGGRVTFRVRNHHATLQVLPSSEGVSAVLRISVTADALDVQCAPGPDSREEMARLRTVLAEEIRREAQAAMAVVRESGADVFGLGQTLFRVAPADYRARAGRWPDVLAEMPVEIEVEARVPRTGQRYGALDALPQGEGPP